MGGKFFYVLFLVIWFLSCLGWLFFSSFFLSLAALSSFGRQIPVHSLSFSLYSLFFLFLFSISTFFFFFLLSFRVFIYLLCLRSVYLFISIFLFFGITVLYGFVFFPFPFPFWLLSSVLESVRMEWIGLVDMDGWMGWMDEWIGNRKEVLRFLVGICVISSFFWFFSPCFALLFCTVLVQYYRISTYIT